MGKKKSLAYQAKGLLTSMQSYGHSKHADKAANGGKPAMEKIYSISTMGNYIDSTGRFSRWVNSAHPDCRSIDAAREYAGEYLTRRIEAGYSAWTVRADAAALGKLYQCATTDFGVELPSRHAADVTQHRDSSTWRGHFSEEKNADLVEFCQACGLRRHEVVTIKPDDVYFDAEGRLCVHVERGKGGKVREVVCVSDAPYRLAERAREQEREYLFDRVPKYAPVHAYRAEYARELYRNIARDIRELPEEERYRARSSHRGEVYDRAAMLEVSHNLGHNRLDVVMAYF